MSWKMLPAVAVRALVTGAVLIVAGACGKDAVTGPSTGSVQITTTSSGDGIDSDGYTVTIDDGDAQPIDASGTLTIDDLSAGSHTVTLAGLADNCTVTGNPATATVTAGETATVAFAITCSATTSTLTVTTASTGDHVDPNGYAIAVDDGEAQPIAASGTATIDGLTAGNHTLTLSGLASNCTTTGNPATITVTAGTPAEASFAITCGPRTLAFESNARGSSDIFTIHEDGSGLTRITTDTTFEGFAVWSPDGQTIAFTSLRNNNLDIFTMDAAGGNVKRVTTDAGEDGVASWSPDGTQLAFASTRSGSAQIWVVNADGTKATQLTHLTPPGSRDSASIMDSLALATEPAWSPDGKSIAFQARPGGAYHIWVVSASDPGTPTELTTGDEDEAPAWSPDGTTIVYASKQGDHFELMEVNVSDKHTTALTSGSAFDNRAPVFAPDGKTIAFYSDRTGTPQVWTMDITSKAATQVNANTAAEGRPSWRP